MTRQPRRGVRRFREKSTATRLRSAAGDGRPPDRKPQHPRQEWLMLNRRNLLLSAVAFAAACAAARAADDWKKQYPELTIAVVPAENASGVSDRFQPFVEYLSKELGVPVKLRVAND